MEELSSNFIKFTKLHSKRDQKEKDYLNSNQLADDIRKMPQYYEIVKDFSKHLNTLHKIVKIYHRDQFTDMIRMAQGFFIFQQYILYNFLDFKKISMK